jgi:uncharacterized protein
MSRVFSGFALQPDPWRISLTDLSRACLTLYCAEGRWRIRTVLLLTISNIFMTFAWYGHLKYKSSPLWIAILVSWMIAFAEYCFQVPANRYGHGQFSAAQLKTIQEIITLTVFAVFSVLYLKEEFRWNYLIGFALIVVAAFFIFKKP